MSKKILVTYSFLFLFAFTFALSLTLASSAQAVENCCVVQWCPGGPPDISIRGHMVRPNPWSDPECVYTNGEHWCDMYFIC